MITIVLAIDNLPACLLECYGSTLTETPHFDCLASQAVTFNWHFADSMNSIDANHLDDRHPWMTGLHSFRSEADSSSLQERLEIANVDVVMLSESTSKNQNSFSELIDQAIDTFQNLISSRSQHPTLLWLNAKGITSSEINLNDFDEEDQEEAELVNLILQVEQFDIEAGRLFDAILDACQTEKVLFIVTSAKGEIKGSGLFSQKRPDPFIRPEYLVHTPLMIVAPEIGSAERRLELVQTIDLLPTIEEWLIQQPAMKYRDGCSLWSLLRNEASLEKPWRETLYMTYSDNIFALRTSKYYFIEERSLSSLQEESKLYLYLKPDDLWDHYNVAKQYPQVVEELQNQLHIFFEQC